MYNKFLGGKRGFGLISVMMVLIFSTIATSSMYIASIYVRYKANENYHYRKALFALKGEMDTYRRSFDKYGTKPASTFKIVTLDTMGSNPVEGTITLRKTSNISDIEVATTAVYDKIEWTIKWDEPLIINETIVRRREMKIMLREDFYHLFTLSPQ